MRDLVERFAALFEGRKDAYGADHGECVRVGERNADSLDSWSNDIDGLWLGHLNGKEPIGVYPLVWRDDGNGGGYPAEWVVKWGCSDIDVDDLQAAINLRNALHVLGITGWIEVSKSKGYHVWVFAQTWVPAATMRNAFLSAHQLAELRATEVNPKQTQLEAGQLGNYVRLPYPGGLNETPERRAVLGNPNTEADHVRRLSLEGFLHHAAANRTPQSALERAASLYVPPPPPKPIAVMHTSTDDPFAVGKLSGLAYTIWRDGPLEEGDRSGTLFKLAAKAFEDGLTSGEVYRVVEDADQRWGKFYARADCQKQLTNIVQRAAHG